MLTVRAVYGTDQRGPINVRETRYHVLTGFFASNKAELLTFPLPSNCLSFKECSVSRQRLSPGHHQYHHEYRHKLEESALVAAVVIINHPAWESLSLSFVLAHLMRPAHVSLELCVDQPFFGAITLVQQSSSAPN